MKKLISLLLLLELIMSVSLNAQTNGSAIELATGNPYKTDFNQLMRYSDVTVAHFNAYVDEVLAYSAREVNSIILQEQPTFQNTFGVYDAIYSNLNIALRNANMMIGLFTDAAAREVGEAASLRITSALLAMHTNKKLYYRFNSFSKDKVLTKSEKRLVQEVLKEFMHSGVLLAGEKESEMIRLNSEIKKLNLQFMENFSNSRPSITLTKEAAAGLSDAFLAKHKNEQNHYVIPVNNATKRTLLTSLISEESRKKIHTLDQTRGEGNDIVLDSLLKKRHQVATLMGYSNYADYQLQMNMLTSKDTIVNTLNDLINKTRPNALLAYNKIKANRNSILGTHSNAHVEPWNQPFYSTTSKESKRILDQIAEYNIPMETASRNVFDMYEKMLGLEIRQIKDPSVWNSDITAYEVYDNHVLKGRFYMDMYARPKKDPGFRAQWLTFGRKTEKGYELPVAILIADYATPTEQDPGFIPLNGMTIFIHEFGHIMSMMVYDGDYARIAMPSMDFIEVMSKMFENWLGEYDFAKNFLLHPKTGIPISQELFEEYNALEREQRGMASIGQFRFALYSMQLYSDYNPENPKNTDQLWRDIDNKINIFPYFTEGTHPQNNFIHLTAYAASYYSYIWSNLIAQDMFTEFKKNGLSDQVTGKRFRNLILANGRQIQELEAVEKFLGRKVSKEPYLQWLGVK